MPGIASIVPPGSGTATRAPQNCRPACATSTIAEMVAATSEKIGNAIDDKRIFRKRLYAGLAGKGQRRNPNAERDADERYAIATTFPSHEFTRSPRIFRSLAMTRRNASTIGSTNA